MTERALYTLTLRPEPAGVDKHGRDPEYRLRVALKTLSRGYGLRCVRIVPTAAGEPVCGRPSKSKPKVATISKVNTRAEIVAKKAVEKMKAGKGADGSGGRGRKKNPSAILPKGLSTRAECAKAAGRGKKKVLPILAEPSGDGRVREGER